MTQDEIIEMAESIGVHEYGPRTRNWSFELSKLETFAKLVAEKEREACAKLCESEGLRIDASYLTCAEAIRARGDYT